MKRCKLDRALMVAVQRLGHQPRRCVDRESCRAKISFQNRTDLGAAKRRYNESVAASIHSLEREANYG